MEKKQGMKISGGQVAVFAAVMLAVGAVVFALRPAPASLPAHPVSIPIAAEGLDTSSGTPVPVRVQGVDASGVPIDQVYAIQGDGSGAQLPEGSYSISVTSSPIAADGTIYSIVGALAAATVDAEGGLELGSELVLAPVAALEADDDAIAAAYDGVKGLDGMDAARAASLRYAAVKRREGAVAEAERRNDPAAQARAQGKQVFTGTVRMYDREHGIWMELHGYDPNDPDGTSPYGARGVAMLYVEGSPQGTGISGDPTNHERFALPIENMALGYGEESVPWQQYDGQRVVIAVDDLRGFSDVRPMQVSAMGPHFLKLAE